MGVAPGDLRACSRDIGNSDGRSCDVDAHVCQCAQAQARMLLVKTIPAVVVVDVAVDGSVRD